MSNFTKLMKQAASGGAGESVYVDDVFSTYLYTGNNSGGSTPTQTITNGIDLSGEGGLVWLKSRSNSAGHNLIDTERGIGKFLSSESTGAEGTPNSGFGLTAFNSDGFTLGGTWNTENFNGYTYASWSFRKQAGFFDVVTYTGNSTSGRGIAHNLGSAPGFVIVKCTSDAEVWRCFHRTFSAGNDVSLNSTAAVAANGHFPTVPDADNFYVGAGNQVNGTGKTYVAYVFAHDDQSFGDDSDESIIKCGSYTGNGNADGPEIDLGWEPQWLMIKSTTLTQSWLMLDVMRGFVVGDAYTGVAGSADARLYANLTSAEDSGYNRLDPTSTGFKLTSTASEVNSSGANYIYIAIRRPMKTPESGTEVFAPVTYTGTGAAASIDSGFPVDLYIGQRRTPANVYFNFRDRLRGKNQTLQLPLTSAEYSNSSLVCNFDDMDGVNYTGINLDTTPNASGESDLVWMFKRATGFFDVVTYTGDGTTNARSHNLGVTPELMIVKWRTNNTGEYWYVYHKDLGVNSSIVLQLNSAETGFTITNSTAPTSTQFTLSGGGRNTSGATYIAYLFATLAGISKVGSYTGTGSNVDVDCGFSAGARFVFIKRTDSTGDWYVYDSERGIVAGNDPYLLLNSTAAEVTGTDYIDPLSSGFTVTSSAPAGLNASGGTYIFLAIA